MQNLVFVIPSWEGLGVGKNTIFYEDKSSQDLWKERFAS